MYCPNCKYEGICTHGRNRHFEFHSCPECGCEWKIQKEGNEIEG
jgi:Zn-finger nucleic acid-binding protein